MSAVEAPTAVRSTQSFPPSSFVAVDGADSTEGWAERDGPVVVSTSRSPRHWV